MGLSPRRAAGVVLACGGIFLLAWAGPAVWWVLRECRAACAVQGGAGRLTLPSGPTLQLLSKTVDGDTIHIDYVTESLLDEPQLCAEVRELFGSLATKGEFTGMRKVYVMPTGPHAQLLGTTWRGPVFSCCRSTGVVFRKADLGVWRVPAGLCKE